MSTYLLESHKKSQSQKIISSNKNNHWM